MEQVISNIIRYSQDDLSLIERGGQTAISGYAMLWYDGTPRTEYHIGNYVERIERQAIRETLSKVNNGEWVVVARYNHSKDYELDSTSQTLTLRDDDRGLFYNFPTDGQDPDHNKVVVGITKKRIKGSSFAARSASGKWSTEGKKQVFTITNIIDLIDVAPVNNPAYKNTTALCRGEQDERALEQYEQYLQSLKETDKRLLRLNDILSNL